MKSKKKYYLIVSEKNNWRYGAFDFSEEGKKKVSNIPIGRIAEACEIADTVKFLCSNKASYITGQTINLNGGMYFG